MGEFACVSMVEKKWFQYFGHRWKWSDGGVGLRIKLYLKNYHICEFVPQ